MGFSSTFVLRRLQHQNARPKLGTFSVHLCGWLACLRAAIKMSLHSRGLFCLWPRLAASTFLGRPASPSLPGTKTLTLGATLILIAALSSLGLPGCLPLQGYSNDSLYRKDIQTVCVHMFDNRSFRRNLEYDLTDALAKRIEAQTPYKIVSDQDRADTLITGQIISISEIPLVMDRELGRALESELHVQAVVNWKNLKTGDLLIDSQTVVASADYSQFLDQGVGYAKNLTANKLAEQIVRLMEEKW